MEVRALKIVRMARGGYILMSVIFYIAGTVCMMVPSRSPFAFHRGLGF